MNPFEKFLPKKPAVETPTGVIETTNVAEVHNFTAETANFEEMETSPEMEAKEKYEDYKSSLAEATSIEGILDAVQKYAVDVRGISALYHWREDDGTASAIEAQPILDALKPFEKPEVLNGRLAVFNTDFRKLRSIQDMLVLAAVKRVLDYEAMNASEKKTSQSVDVSIPVTYPSRERSTIAYEGTEQGLTSLPDDHDDSA